MRYLSTLIILVIATVLISFCTMLIFKFVGKKRLSALLIILMSVVLSIILSALYAQFFVEIQPVQAGWRAKTTTGGLNQLGLRGRPFECKDGDFVVLLVGDSQVECSNCEPERMPERLLESYLVSAGLPAKVFSLGSMGYGQDQELLLLEEYFRSFSADLVVLWLTPTNDLWNNLFPTHYPINGMPKPTFWLENGALRGPNWQMGQSLDLPWCTLLMLMRRVYNGNRWWGADQRWVRHVPAPYRPMTSFDGPVNQRWENNRALQPKREHIESEKRHLAIYLVPPSERMEYAVSLTRALLERIRVLTETHQARFCLFRVQQPVDHLDPGEQVYRFKGNYFKASPDQLEQTMTRVEQGFPAFVIRNRVADWQVSQQDHHLNDAANDQVLADLATGIRDWLITTVNPIR
ncbi:hypothetical protein JXQ70_17025 [bacterium]|nr:hypothetical protein [bacterium]